VFGFGPLCSSARNRRFGLTGKLTRRRALWINRTFASVARIVLDPRYRGAGVASAFLRRCCRRSPWPWIELTSEMADLVPFCEAAGFHRIARARDKSRTPAGKLRTATRAANCYGRSGWTDQGFLAYHRRARFSRPVYYLFDNRRGNGKTRTDAAEPGTARG